MWRADKMLQVLYRRNPVQAPGPVLALGPAQAPIEFTAEDSQKDEHSLSKNCPNVTQGKRSFCWMLSVIILMTTVNFELDPEMQGWLHTVSKQFNDGVFDTACPKLPKRLSIMFETFSTSFRVIFHQVVNNEDIPNDLEKIQLFFKDSLVVEDVNFFPDFNLLEIFSLDSQTQLLINDTKIIKTTFGFYRIQIVDDLNINDTAQPDEFLIAFLRTCGYGVSSLENRHIGFQDYCKDVVLNDLDTLSDPIKQKLKIFSKLSHETIPERKYLDNDFIGVTYTHNHFIDVTYREKQKIKRVLEAFVAKKSVHLKTTRCPIMAEDYVKSQEYKGGLVIYANEELSASHSIAMVQCESKVQFCNTWSRQVCQSSEELELEMNQSKLYFHSAILLSPIHRRTKSMLEESEEDLLKFIENHSEETIA